MVKYDVIQAKEIYTKLIYNYAKDSNGAANYYVATKTTGAADDVLGYDFFTGYDDGGNLTYYGQTGWLIYDPTDTAEGGMFAINPMDAGTFGALADSPYLFSPAGYFCSKPLYLSQAEQALTGAGAINLTSSTTAWTTTAADAGTLADSTEDGQIKFIYMAGDGGNGTLTPTSLLGYSTITFTAVGQSVILYWNGSNWVILSNMGTTLG